MIYHQSRLVIFSGRETLLFVGAITNTRQGEIFTVLAEILWLLTKIKMEIGLAGCDSYGSLSDHYLQVNFAGYLLRCKFSLFHFCYVMWRWDPKINQSGVQICINFMCPTPNGLLSRSSHFRFSFGSFLGYLVLKTMILGRKIRDWKS